MTTTRLSSKGQVILPKAVRTQRGWKRGTEFVIESVGEGVLLKPLKRFKRTHLQDLLGCTGYSGPAKSLADMERAIVAGARGDK